MAKQLIVEVNILKRHCEIINSYRWSLYYNVTPSRAKDRYFWLQYSECGSYYEVGNYDTIYSEKCFIIHLLCW